jgi:hypothetical protein
MNLQTDKNGRPQDTPGDQGRKEAQRQDSLQLQACATDGISERKARDFIVHIENASDFKSAFIIRQVKTVPQLVQGIYDWHPKLCHESILMRVSDTRTGSMHRVYYEKDLPHHTDTVYVYLSLRKHTNMGSKIEHNCGS